MRALAWWRTAPEPADKAKSESRKKEPPVSRLRDAETRDLEVHLPEVQPEVLYLVDTLLEAGPTSICGAGYVPLTWGDLQAWSRGTGIALEPWEARLVRQLSAEWLAEYDRAKNPRALPPWETNEEAGVIVRAAEDLRSRIAAMAA